jgi:hypothetical protein
VEQSWSNVYRLLSRLHSNRTYCAKDLPLVIWKEGEQLHIKYYWPEIQVAEECVFSEEETKGIIAMLGTLPGLN